MPFCSSKYLPAQPGSGAVPSTTYLGFRAQATLLQVFQGSAGAGASPFRYPTSINCKGKGRFPQITTVQSSTWVVFVTAQRMPLEHGEQE